MQSELKKMICVVAGALLIQFEFSQMRFERQNKRRTKRFIFSLLALAFFPHLNCTQDPKPQTMAASAEAQKTVKAASHRRRTSILVCLIKKTQNANFPY